MISRTLIRYFGMRFLGAVMSVFFGIFLLIVLVDYIEMMRRAADVPDLSGLDGRQGLVLPRPANTERLLPFSVLVGAMVCYLALSRRNELVVARSAGMSAWQFIAPAADRGVRDRDRRDRGLQSGLGRHARMVEGLEAEMFGDRRTCMQQRARIGFWVRQRSVDGQSIVYAASSQEQGVRLDGVSVFTFDPPERLWSASRPRAPCWSPATGGSSRRASMSAGSRRATTTPIWSRPT